jgi:23S rRNA pseudouridine1911/1915/1917 synthase
MEILRGERSSSYKAFIQNGFKLCPRQALHARTLGFVHPKTGKQMDFTSELPADMQALIAKWRIYISGRKETETIS